MENIKIQRIRQQAQVPKYMSSGAAGADLIAAILTPLVLIPNQATAIPCGFRMEIPPGFEAQIRPRSGLALKNNITVANAPGTIDSDYRGEVQVILINLGVEPYEIQPQDRIAQMVISPVIQAGFELTKELGESERGEGGFGSTGSQ